jgi:hypothetical protein
MSSFQHVSTSLIAFIFFSLKYKVILLSKHFFIIINYLMLLFFILRSQKQIKKIDFLVNFLIIFAITN